MPGTFEVVPEVEPAPMPWETTEPEQVPTIDQLYPIAPRLPVAGQLGVFSTSPDPQQFPRV